MLGRLYRWAHPAIAGGMQWVHYCLLSVLLSVIVLAHNELPGMQSSFFGNGQYYPAPALFHITNTQYVVASQSWWDASSCWCQPVADIDYIFPPWWQEYARLPGSPDAHYRWVTAGYIPGSGYYSTWMTPNGGHFTYYHLTWSSWSGSRGGDIVGMTSWPTSPLYGNGSAGPYNAHECIAYDAAAQWWFQVGIFYVPPAPKPKPKPFPRARWGPTSPYYKGRLDWAATVWLSHQNLGKALDRGHYYGRGHGGYTKTRFQHGAIFTWVYWHKAKVTYAARKR